MLDVVYTNGVIAAKETSLLGSKIYKLCEMSADDAFRAVLESGFLRGAEVSSVFEYEKLLAADDRDIDAFIREYAPTNAEKAYFLTPRDFHNAKAIVKAFYTGAEEEKMLAPEGLLSVEQISLCIKEENYDPLGKELAQACKESAQLFKEENSSVTGAQVGAIFENALYRCLNARCKSNSFLKNLIKRKADYTNVLTALRSHTPEYAATNYVEGGKIKREKLEKLFTSDDDKIVEEFKGSGLEEFLKACLEAKRQGLPYTKAERMLSDLETEQLAAKKYELKNTQPFLYYVLRRRAENLNLRILFVCLMAGMDENDIKKRLRLV